MILVNGPEPLLIVIEAKLYDGTLEADLMKEMDRQKKNVLDYLCGCWPDLRTIHAALVPEAMKSEFGGREMLGELEESLPSYRRVIITWEQIRDAYAGISSTAYFSEMLRIAIEEYDNLKGDKLTFGKYKDGSLSGSEILNRYEQPFNYPQISTQLAHRFFPLFDSLAPGTHGASPRDARTNRSISRCNFRKF